MPVSKAERKVPKKVPKKCQKNAKSDNAVVERPLICLTRIVAVTERQLRRAKCTLYARANAAQGIDRAEPPTTARVTRESRESHHRGGIIREKAQSAHGVLVFTVLRHVPELRQRSFTLEQNNIEVYIVGTN